MYKSGDKRKKENETKKIKRGTEGLEAHEGETTLEISETWMIATFGAIPTGWLCVHKPFLPCCPKTPEGFGRSLAPALSDSQRH